MTRPILILSHPRSGSSWLGSVLALGQSVSYRREPVLTHRMDTVKDPFASAPVDGDLFSVIEEAYSCEPGETVVVKEVTPLLIGPLTAGRDVIVIHLRRHPGDVAASHLERRWMPSNRLLRRAGVAADASEALRERWADLSDFAKLVGYFGAVDASVANDFSAVDAIEVRYEDLEKGHPGAMGSLFASIGLGPADLDRPLADADRSDAYGVGGRRHRTASSWRYTEDVDRAREAWLATGAAGYGDPALWRGLH